MGVFDRCHFDLPNGAVQIQGGDNNFGRGEHLFLWHPKYSITKSLCDKDFAELSGELPGAIGLKTLVLLSDVSKLFRNIFGGVHVKVWLCGSFCVKVRICGSFLPPAC